MQRAKPFVALLLLAGSFATFYIPDLANYLAFEREAILKGEWWRLFSCHLVHFSFSHMLVNLAVLFFAYAIMWSKFRHLEYLLIYSILLIGPALFICDNHLMVFGGSSGLAAAAFFFILLDGSWSSTSIKKVLYCLVLLLCIGKSFYEFQFDVPKSIFLPEEVQTVPLCHLLGYLVATGVYFQRLNKLRTFGWFRLPQKKPSL